MDQLTCMLARKMVGPAPNLGSGLIDQSQKMTVAARAMAEKKAPGLLASARRKGHLERARRLLSVTPPRSEEHTSELQSLMRISYAVFCLKKKKNNTTRSKTDNSTN